MDGLNGVLRSKKLWGAVIGAVLIAGNGEYFKDHPQIVEIIVGISSLFGVVIAGQAHADANDPNYRSDKKPKKK